MEEAWGPAEPAPGLLAAGGTLEVPSLLEAYGKGVFPWFSLGQPVLWWSPEPRMVLKTRDFRLHRSLKKVIKAFNIQPDCAVSFDRCFERVINACASQPRQGQPGTWIVPEMIAAYVALHEAGHAHSVETWMDGELAGGLYLVNLGGMVFGESMFANRTDASKIALAALVAFCRVHHIDMIDCQQNTGHLSFLGAQEIPRQEFVDHVRRRLARTPPQWNFDTLYWNEILTVST